MILSHAERSEAGQFPHKVKQRLAENKLLNLSSESADHLDFFLFLIYVLFKVGYDMTDMGFVMM